MPWIRCFFLLWALTLPHWASAQNCDSITPTLSPAPASLYTAPASTQVVWSGTLTIVYTNCQGGGPGVEERSAFSNNFTTMGVGLAGNIRATSLTATPSGNCVNWQAPFPGTYGSNQRMLIVYWTYSIKCTYTITVGIEIQMTTTGYGGVYNSNSMAPLTPGNGWHQSQAKTAGQMFVYKPNLTIEFRTLKCTISTNSLTFTLPDIAQTALASQGTGPLRPFTITLGGCGNQAIDYQISLKFSFSPGPQANLIANDAPSNKAANVYVQLLDPAQTVISNNATVPYATLKTSGPYLFDKTFYARYATPGSPGAGKVQALANITITYQ